MLTNCEIGVPRLYKIDVIEILDLSHNKLSGMIPSDLGRCFV